MGLNIIDSLLAGSEFIKMAGFSISLILIMLGGITYGIAQTQPAERRGKWESAAFGMFIGGLVVAAILGASEIIRDWGRTAIVSSNSTVTLVD